MLGSDDRLILGGDVGGTNIRLVLADGARQVARAVYRTRDYAAGGLVAAVIEFLEGRPTPAVAVFGVAGPVVGGRLPRGGINLPFSVDPDELRSRTGISRVHLLNDLEAAAWGLDDVSPQQIVTVVEGAEDATGTKAVVAPGTGFGGAYCLSLEQKTRVHPGEPGHASLSPADPDHARFWLRCWNEEGRAPTVEDEVSGPGLLRLYRHCAEEARRPPIHSTPEAVAAAGLGEADHLARRAVEMLIEALAHECRCTAIRVCARGGVYLTGGVTEALADALSWPSFERVFRAPGPAMDVIADVAVHRVTEPQLGLAGALAYGRDVLQA